MALLSRSGLVNFLNIILYINETKLNELWDRRKKIVVCNDMQVIF